MATFVDLSSEEEQVFELVNYLANLRTKKEPEFDAQGFKNEIARLVGENRIKEAIIRLINEHEVVFGDSSERDVEGFFNVITSQIKKADASAVNPMVQRLREVVTSSTNKASLRLKILTNLYNSFDAASIGRFETFYAIAKYAGESGNSEAVVPKFKQVDAWLRKWNASIEQKRALFKVIAQLMKDTVRPLAAHRYLVKYLNTFNGGDVAEAQEDAARAAIEAIELEDIYQMDDLLQLEAVQALQGHLKHGPLITLLTIFSRDRLDAYNSFMQQHPEFVKSVGLNEQACHQKIRLLSLTSLAAEKEDLPYALIAQTLQVSEDEVENWVIMAISAKLIDAKIDQLKRLVIINYSMQRVFNEAQWQQLSGKLKGWRSHIERMQNVIQMSKQHLREGRLEQVMPQLKAQ